MENKQAIPLHPAQLGIFYDQQLNGLAAKHNIGGYIRIRGQLDCKLLQQACEICWQQSADVRLRLLTDGAEPMQELGVNGSMPELQKLDFIHQKEGKQLASHWMQAQMDTGMGLQQYPLFEHALIAVAPQEQWYFMRQHHISADAYTFSLRIQDLLICYEQLSSDQPVNLKARFSFSDEVFKALSYQGSEAFKEDEQFWQQRSTSLQWTPQLSDATESKSEQRIVLTRALTRLSRNELIAVVKENGITIQHLVLTALTACFGALTQGQDFVIGTPVHNRVTRKQKQMLGMLVTVMPTFVSIDAQKTLLENAKRVAKSQNAGLAHRQYPWSNVLNYIRKQHPERTSLFDVIFNYETFHKVDAPEGLEIELHELSSAIDDTPMRLIFTDFGKKQAPAISIQASAGMADYVDVNELMDSVLRLLDDTARTLPLKLHQVLDEICHIQSSALNAKANQTKTTQKVTLSEQLLQQLAGLQPEYSLQQTLSGAWSAFMAKYQHKTEFECLNFLLSNTDEPVKLHHCSNLSIAQHSLLDVLKALTQVQVQTFTLSELNVEGLAIASRDNVFPSLFFEGDQPTDFDKHRLLNSVISGINAETQHFSLLHAVFDHEKQPQKALELSLIIADSQGDHNLYPDLCDFVNFLEFLTEKENQAVALLEVPLASESIQKSLLEKWQPQVMPPLEPLSLHARFEQQVRLWPEKIAVICPNQSVSYEQLNVRANQIAHQLQRLNLNSGELIGLYFERNSDTLAAILGILKAGCAYLPLNPQYPSKNLKYLVEDGSINIVLSTVKDHSLSGEAKLPQSVRLLQVSEIIQSNDPVAESFTQSSVSVAPDSLAYVIYTSGTTGKPKGVLQTHANVCRLFDATQSDFHFSERDVWTLFHSISFDVSVWEMWGALLHGGKLIIPDFDCTRAPKQLLALCLEHKVTVFSQTPSAFLSLSLSTDYAQQGASNWPELRYVVFAGEALKNEHLAAWISADFAPNARLINMYGITETTVHVTFKEIDKKNSHITIGRAIKDQAILLLDEKLRPVPPGAVGEIYIAGQGLALGYKNRAELTSEKFITEPEELPTIKRLYRSGDLARYDLANEEFIYIGRNDSQVKLNGFRIELGEIEQQVSQHPDIKQSAVLVKESGQETFLVAFVVSGVVINEQLLMSYFQQRLPGHMLPRRYLQLEEMPLTTNVKLDRTALSQLPLPNNQENIIPARNAYESLILDVCQTLLDNQQLGVNSVLFQYGWHSVGAARAAAQLTEIFQVELSVKTLLLAPTCSDIAVALEELCGGPEVAQEIAETYLMLASMSDEEVEQMLAAQEAV